MKTKLPEDLKGSSSGNRNDKFCDYWPKHLHLADASIESNLKWWTPIDDHQGVRLHPLGASWFGDLPKATLTYWRKDRTTNHGNDGRASLPFDLQLALIMMVENTPNVLCFYMISEYQKWMFTADIHLMYVFGPDISSFYRCMSFTFLMGAVRVNIKVIVGQCRQRIDACCLWLA